MLRLLRYRVLAWSAAFLLGFCDANALAGWLNVSSGDGGIDILLPLRDRHREHDDTGAIQVTVVTYSTTTSGFGPTAADSGNSYEPSKTRGPNQLK